MDRAATSPPAGLRQRGPASRQAAEVAPAAPGSDGGECAEPSRLRRGKAPDGAAAAGNDSTDATSEGGEPDDDEFDGPDDGDADSGSIGSNPHGPADLDDGEWEEMFASPLDVRFTQEKIHPFFYRRGPIVNVVPKIRPVLRGSGVPHDPDAVIELVPPFHPIHCLRKGEELWSLDNRRLYALQLAAMEHWPQRTRIRILARDRLPRHKLKMNWRKFSTTCEGRSVDVSARYQQFDHWSWFERAAEVEAATFSQRIGFLLTIFQFLPVVGALLFRTGLTGFSSRVPLVSGFILTLATDLLRQKAPALERRMGALQAQALLDGEVRPSPTCWRRLRFLRRRGAAVDQSEEEQQAAEEDEEEAPMSAPQLAAAMALVLLLLLPYLVGIVHSRLRSSLLSCWAGVACVLAIQLGTLLRGDDSDTGEKLSPKH